MEELNELLKQRRVKLDELREQGSNPFANDFKTTHVTADVHEVHAADSKEALESIDTEYVVAGRIMAMRDFGKAAFVQLQDRSGRLQVYVAKQQVGDENFELFRKFDVGDIVGVAGVPELQRQRLIPPDLLRQAIEVGEADSVGVATSAVTRVDLSVLCCAQGLQLAQDLIELHGLPFDAEAGQGASRRCMTSR